MKIAIALIATLGLGCSDSKSGSHDPPSTSHQSATKAPVAPKESSANDAGSAADAGANAIAIFLDGKKIASVPLARFAEPVELSSVIDVPKSDWKVVEGYATKHRALALRKPQETYADQKVMLFTDDNGKACFGTFLREDRAPPNQKHLLGKPRLFVRGIVEVRIRTQEQELAQPEPTVLEIAVGKKVMKLSGDQVAELSRVELPSGGSDRPSWKLSTVVGLVTKSRPKKLVLTAMDRSTLTIPGAALRDSKQLITLKLNRRGLYKLQWFDTSAEPWKLVSDMRGVTRIDVVK